MTLWTYVFNKQHKQGKNVCKSKIDGLGFINNTSVYIESFIWKEVHVFQGIAEIINKSF